MLMEHDKHAEGPFTSFRRSLVLPRVGKHLSDGEQSSSSESDSSDDDDGDGGGGGQALPGGHAAPRDNKRPEEGEATKVNRVVKHPEEEGLTTKPTMTATTSRRRKSQTTLTG